MSSVVGERLASKCAELLRSDDGAAAIEYGLLGALIAGAILIALNALGSSLNGTFSHVASAQDPSQSGASGGGGGGNNGNGRGGNGNGNNGVGNGNGGPNGG
jgi:Flp pilus assembly pilin Flp